MRRPCLTCGTLTTLGTRCAGCQARRDAIVERRRGSASRRGYGQTHRLRSVALRLRSQREDAPCAICGRPIDYSLAYPNPRAYSAHHLTTDKLGPLVPAHLRCNVSAGRPQR